MRHIEVRELWLQEEVRKGGGGKEGRLEGPKRDFFHFSPSQCSTAVHMHSLLERGTHVKK